MNKEQFLKLKSRKDVADILGIPDKSLRYFLYGTNMYHEFSIPKRNGGKRTIKSPNKSLKKIQRKLADILNDVYKIKPAAHGFVFNKNVKTNASNHKKKRYVLNVDLKDFFTQIHFGRIKGMLSNPPYQLGEEASIAITQLVCYKGTLPQGAPTSPIISNMISSPLDTQLTKLAKKYRLNYSRYADDITFSSFKEKLPKGIVYQKEDTLHIGKELESIFQKHSFPINYEKIRMFDYRKRQMVTGLVVNKFPNLPRENIKEIRAILHDCKKNGIINAAQKYFSMNNGKNKLSTLDQEEEKERFLQVLKGKVEYIKNIRGTENLTFLKYAKEINQIWDRSVFSNIDEQLDLLRKVENSVFVLESKSPNNPVQGSGFIAKDKGLFTNYHVIENDDFYTVKTYKRKEVATISTHLLYKSGSEAIDYALFNVKTNNEYGWEVGNSDDLLIGDELIVIGYPNYFDGNSPDIQNAKFTSERTWLGNRLYTIDKRIIHGASGGIVIKRNNKKVVGIINTGAQTLNDSETDERQGFIPINDVLDHMNKEDR